MGAKSLCVSFDKIDRFITVYDGTRYLVLPGAEKSGWIYNRIWYVIGVKWHYMCYFSNYARV